MNPNHCLSQELNISMNVMCLIIYPVLTDILGEGRKERSKGKKGSVRWEGK
jgi:hypothetical protein